MLATVPERAIGLALVGSLRNYGEPWLGPWTTGDCLWTTEARLNMINIHTATTFVAASAALGWLYSVSLLASAWPHTTHPTL